MATAERRRPAVPLHPLAAVPAATCTRQMPEQPLGRGRASTVVHALVDDHQQTLCRLRVRHLEMWDGTPLRLCSICAQALTARHLGPFWRPTRAELAELHLHAADQLVDATRERLADIRSAAIYDGSALMPVDQLPTYRAARGVPADQEPAPLRAAVILGQLLARVAPPQVVVPAAEELAAQARTERAAADQQRLTDRVVAGNNMGREDRRAARQAKRRTR